MILGFGYCKANPLLNFNPYDSMLPETFLGKAVRIFASVARQVSYW